MKMNNKNIEELEKAYRQLSNEKNMTDKKVKEILKLVNGKTNLLFYSIAAMKKMVDFRDFNNAKFVAKCFMKIFDRNINLEIKEANLGYRIKRIMDDSLISKDQSKNQGHKSKYLKYAYYKQVAYSEVLEDPKIGDNENVKKVIDLIKNNIKPIAILFGSTDAFYQKRINKISSDLSKQGFICFIIKPNKNKYFEIKEDSPYTYLLNDEKYLLAAIKSEYILVYCNNINQKTFIDNIDNKMLWYDVLKNDKSNIQFDLHTLAAHNDLMGKSNIITFDDYMIDKELCQQGKSKKLKVYFNHDENECINNVGDLFDMLPDKLQLYKLMARYNNTNNVSVLTTTFYNFDGVNYYCGGAERYLVDLSEICSKLGVRMDIYQAGNYPWIRKYKNINVISSNFSTKPFDHNNRKPLNDCFIYKNMFRSQLNIFSAFTESLPRTLHPNIGISHGIFWDNTYSYSYNFAERFTLPLDAVESLDKLVSVDTNTINWFQTIDYNSAQSMEYIPNYVDRTVFKPTSRKSEEIVILFPRRLYTARGFYVLLNIADDLLSKYDNVKLWFVGRGFEEDTKHLEAKMEKWPGRIEWSQLEPEEMPSAYQQADISLVPTLHSEGTSLSCLEAMASGNIVVCTRVGGLTDLVIDKYNGFLINPNEESLLESLSYIVDNYDKLDHIKKNGLAVAKCFDKKNWNNRWTSIINKIVKKQGNKIDKSEAYVVYLKHKSELLSEDINKIISFLLKNNKIVFVYCEEYSNKEIANNSMYRFQLLNSLNDIEYDYFLSKKKTVVDSSNISFEEFIKSNKI